jgi:hypothetical protein
MTDIEAMINTLELTNSQAEELRQDISFLCERVKHLGNTFKSHTFQRLLSGKEPYYLEVYIISTNGKLSIEWFKPYFSENEYFEAMELVKKADNDDN